MYKIQTLNKIAAIGLDRLPRDNYETASEIAHPDGILVRSQDMHGLELPETVLAIARAGREPTTSPFRSAPRRASSCSTPRGRTPTR